MTSEREFGLALMNIHYGRQIDISATIDLFAPKYPLHLLLSDILAECTVNINHNFIQHLMKYVICGTLDSTLIWSNKIATCIITQLQPFQRKKSK